MTTKNIEKLSTKSRLFPRKNSQLNKAFQKSRTHIPNKRQLYVVDLHGKTQEEAFELLVEKFKYCTSIEEYHLLVITGKGSEDKPSILKQELPRWLDYTELSHYVLKHKITDDVKGGEGAREVILRKNS
ncbi:MAG: Smr/MutS family protein [Rickettsiales bacterium]